jgi:ketosteroid isomerase-like protein
MAVWDADAVKDTIDTRNRELARWYAEGNIDSVAAVFAADAWQMPPNAPPLIGRQAIHAFWSQAIQWGKWEFTSQAQQVNVSGLNGGRAGQVSASVYRRRRGSSRDAVV